MPAYWTVWERCGAVWTLQGSIQSWVCPTACHGTLEIDSPPLAAVEELAPDGTVVGEGVPSTRDALTGDYGREIKET